MKLPLLTAKGLPWGSRTPGEQEEEIRRLMRRVFCESTDGAIALGVLLDDFGWNDATKTEADVIMRNFATRFLQKRLGISTDTLATVVAIINNQVHKE